MTNQEKKLAKSNNRKTYKSKIKSYGYSLALVTALWLTWCGSDNLEVKKAAEKYQHAIEQVKKTKEKLQNREEDLKDAEKDVKEAKENLKNAEEEVQKTKEDLKKESGKL